MEIIHTEQRQRQIDMLDTLEVQVLQSVLCLRDKVDNGILYVGQITNAFNEGKRERQQITPSRIGRVLKALGFSKTRFGRKGLTAILWNEDLIQRMCEKYGLHTVESPSEDSEASVCDEGTEGTEGLFPGAG